MEAAPPAFLPLTECIDNARDDPFDLGGMRRVLYSPSGRALSEMRSPSNPLPRPWRSHLVAPRPRILLTVDAVDCIEAWPKPMSSLAGLFVVGAEELATGKLVFNSLTGAEDADEFDREGYRGRYMSARRPLLRRLEREQARQGKARCLTGSMIKTLCPRYADRTKRCSKELQSAFNALSCHAMWNECYTIQRRIDLRARFSLVVTTAVEPWSCSPAW